MSATITIPADLEQLMLREAAVSGQKFEEFAIKALRALVEKPLVLPFNHTEAHPWLDLEYMAACGKEADPSITLASVRQVLLKIPDSLADAVIAEREERC
jgi:hypothetical protein